MFSIQKIKSKLKWQPCKGFGACLTVGTANGPTAEGVGQSKAKQGLTTHINENTSKGK